MKKTIAVVAGGTSREYMISMRSAQTVLGCLDTEQFEPYLVVVEADRWYARVDGAELPVDKNNFSFQLKNQTITFEAVYNIIHGTPGEDGKMQGYWDLIGLPYTGCDVLTSAITFSKSVCKELVRTHDITTPQSVVVRQDEDYSADSLAASLTFPCFVKPNNGGSSFGVSKVDQPDQLSAAIEKALEHDREALVEEYIQGQELTCGVFRQDGAAHALPITAILPKNAFFDFQAKYEGASEEVTPAPISEPLTEQCQRLTEKIYTLLHGRGFMRIDYMLRDETLYFIEANTTPGFSPQSIFPEQVRVAGIDLKALVNRQLEEIIK